MGFDDDDQDGPRYAPVPDKGQGKPRDRKPKPRRASDLVVEDPLDYDDGLLNLLEMSRESVPIRKWLVQDLIPMDNVTQFAGDGGLGKSLLMLQLMASTALGLPWLGRGVNGGRALGVFCEDDHAELHRRLYEICAAYQVSMADLDENMMVVERVGQDNALMTFSKWGEEPPQETPLYKKIAASIAAFGPSLIILDSSHDLFIGNENDRTQVRTFVGALRRLTLDNGAALILNSHPSLTGMQSGSGSSGSTGWHNAVRSRLYLQRPEGQPTGNTRVLSKKKLNYGSSDGEIGLEWENGVFVCTDRVGTAQSSMQKMQTGEALQIVVDVVRELNQGGIYPSPSDNHPSLYIVKLLQQRLDLRGLDKRNLANLVQEGMRKGLLESSVAPKSRKGKWRPVIVVKGFKVPVQSLMEFATKEEAEAAAAGAAVTNGTAGGNVTGARAPVTKDTGGPPEMEEPPDSAYEDNERFDRGEDI